MTMRSPLARLLDSVVVYVLVASEKSGAPAVLIFKISLSGPPGSVAVMKSVESMRRMSF